VIPTLLHHLSSAFLTQDHAAGEGHLAEVTLGPSWAMWIIWLPVVSALLCGACAAARVRNKLPGWITVLLLGLSFLLTMLLYLDQPESGAAQSIHIFDWFNIRWGEGPGESFIANFSLYVDSLTLLWMLFVTGLGTLIALYATEYMEADTGSAGYARFFAGVSIFLFAMSCLVMADNLVLLYLGWEGVGFASYYLIGYYYRRPSAVAAAKKAFIVNRIGDLGLALGIWLIWHNYGTVEFAALFDLLKGDATDNQPGGWSVQLIPYLLMLGAFGKSAQLPLYVWLPDAMEGPTPVSALIHAATMVTAGVYLLCRMVPAMELHPYALPTVAWVGTLTALLAATIGMAQYDFKRIWAYSTVSQLGFMFAAVGLLTTVGGAYHVFTHAFFKALLFLTAGAVMHGFAGQLDLRKVSGLSKMRGWSIVTWTMFYGCLCLVGFPIISSGFWSKDLIMAQAFISEGPGFVALGVILVLTALLTAYYTFRVWFRVCLGPVQYEMGDEHHAGDAHDETHGQSAPRAGHHEHGHHDPHAPRLAINGVLIVIAAGAIASIFLGDWTAGLVNHSSAAVADGHGHESEAHGAGFWSNAHAWMPWVASAVTLTGMFIAAWLHWLNRPAADRLRDMLLSNGTTRWLPIAMERKWYVDEVYHGLIRLPLWIGAHLLNLFDRIVIDMLLIDGVARIPRALGRTFQPLQSGVLHDYAKTMAGAAGLVILFVWLMKSGWLDFLSNASAGSL
jgi:NADH-quinone oxidoreductase subunit L